MLIERGDAVVVTMSRNDVFPWQQGCSFPAVYQRGPKGSGDTMLLEVEHEGRKGALQLNGNSLDFVGLYVFPPEVEA